MPIQFDPNNPIPDEYQPEEQPKPTQKPKATQPKPKAPASSSRQQQGPGYNVNLEGVAKWVEENVGIPATDLIDNVFQGDQKTPDQIARERAGQRTQFQNQMDAFRDATRKDPTAEGIRAIAGGAADLATGIVNLPTQIVQGITGKPWYRPVVQGLVPENNTTAGQGLRTLARYAWSSLLPVPGVGGATGLGVKAAGMRAAEGFVQDFAAAEGDGSEDTLIGNIPGLRGLQTNEAYNPLANRALIGLEGALFNAGVPYMIEPLRKAVAWWKAGRPAAGAAEAQAAIAQVNQLGPILKYGGNPNELVVDGLKAATRPAGLPTVPFTAPSLRPVQAVTPQAAAPVAFKPVDMSSKNIQSINFENANGQPGFDLWFADKRFPALLPGTVKKIGKQGSRGRGYGNYIVVESIDPKTGDKVDVLYAHLADGGIKVKEGDSVVPGMELGTQGGTGRVISSDGTIASVDFLAPAAKESKSMRPYKRFNELRRELAEQIGKGGISPGQAQQVMADVAAALPTGQADEVIQETTEQLELLTRKEALDAGYEVAELVPVVARNTSTDIAEEMLRRGPDISVENTARPAKFSMTPNLIRAIGASDDTAFDFLQRIANDINAEDLKAQAGVGSIDPGKIQADFLKTYGADILDMPQELIDQMINDVVVVDRTGRVTLTDTGIFGIPLKMQELSSHASDLAKSAINNDINGASNQLVYLRLLDTASALMRITKLADKTDSFQLARRGFLRNTDKQISEAAQEQIAKYQENDALTNQYLSLIDSARTLIAQGNPDAAATLASALRAIAAVGANPRQQINIYGTALKALLKSGDAAFTGGILTGPGTQSVNAQSLLFNGLGYPLLKYFSAIKPGIQNKQIREEAVAGLSATASTIKDLSDLIPKMWKMMGDETSENLGREFFGLDSKTAENLSIAKQMLESGELKGHKAALIRLAVDAHNLVMHPLYTGTIRKVMGSMDKVADQIAGRQIAYSNAYQNTIAQLGDQPLTPQYSKKFAELLEKQRKQEMSVVFADDGITLVDPEAKKLADMFAFRLNPKDLGDGHLDRFTKSAITFSETPGMKMLGFAFVRSPSVMFKAGLRMTPGINDYLKSIDSVYQNGTPYQKAFVDGTISLSRILALSSFIGGYTGYQVGAGPLRGQERDSWLESNEPFTLKLPFGAQFKYQWLEPIATPMGFFADLGYYARYGAEQAVEDNFSRGLVYMTSRILPAAGSNIVNKSYFQQLATISQLDFGNPSSWKKPFENLGSVFIPQAGLRSQVGQVIDPMYRELRSELLNSFDWFIQKKGGLGLSRFAPEDLDDVTGKPLYKNGVDGDAQSSLLQAFNLFRPLGVTVSKNRFKPVHKYLTEVGIDVADTRDKILGTPLTNEERTEFTRYMTKGGQFEKELLRYFKSDAYKFDKEESALQLQQGFKPSETVAYQQVNKIISNFTQLAMYEMGKGLTTTSVGFMNRRSQQLGQARQEAYNRQQRQLQTLQEYPFQ